MEIQPYIWPQRCERMVGIYKTSIQHRNMRTIDVEKWYSGIEFYHTITRRMQRRHFKTSWKSANVNFPKIKKFITLFHWWESEFSVIVYKILFPTIFLKGSLINSCFANVYIILKIPSPLTTLSKLFWRRAQVTELSSYTQVNFYPFQDT